MTPEIGKRYTFQHCNPDTQDPLNGHTVVVTDVIDDMFTLLLAGGKPMYQFESVTEPGRVGDAYAHELTPTDPNYLRG